MTIDRKGVDQVMNGYEAFANNASYYSLWQSQTLKFTGTVDADGKEILLQNLRVLEGNGTTGLFTLKFHPEGDGNVTNKTPIVGSFNFRVHEPGGVVAGNVAVPQGGSDRFYEMIMNLKIQEMENRFTYEKRIEELETELTAAQMEDEEDDDDEDNILGKIGAMGEKISLASGHHKRRHNNNKIANQ